MKKKLLIGIFGIALICALAVPGCDLGSDVPLVDPDKPVITVQPITSDSVMQNSVVTLSVIAPAIEGNAQSFQWYSCETVSGYSPTAVRGTAVGSGTASTFNPSTETAGTYYYYVVVTNTRDKKSEIAISSLVTLFVNDSDNAAFPKFVTQPVGARYTIEADMVLAPLTVGAESIDTGTLSYQWYKSNANSYTGDMILGAVNATHQPLLKSDNPDADVIGVGMSYYYVTVFNNNNSVSGTKQVFANSSIASIRIDAQPQPAATVIKTQPRDRIYFTGETALALTVEVAARNDNLVPTYQWYSSTSASAAEGGAAIASATNASYTPVIGAGAGVNYYYVVVTVTNELAAPQTAITLSNVVTISVQASETKSSNATFTVNTGTRYQYVRGFGGMDVAWDSFPTTTNADAELMYNPDKLGYNIMRIMVMPNYTDIDRTMEELVGNELMRNVDRSNYYEKVKIVNKYGGYVLASPWSPPAEWKSNNSISGGGRLNPSNYADFARYLKRFCEIMYENGAPIYVVSLQNEPSFLASYDGCEYSQAENRDFWKAPGTGHFTNGVKGFGGGKEIPSVKTMGGESHNEVTYQNLSMDDPTSRAAIDIVGRHIYGNNAPSRYARALDHATDPKETWMTEFNDNSGEGGYSNDSTWNYVWRFMNEVDLTIRLNDDSAFIWWASKRFYSMIGDGLYSSTDGAILPRGHGLSHYAKFAKETRRVQVTGSGTLANGTTPIQAPGDNSNLNRTNFAKDGTGAVVTAFVSEDGNAISLVMYTPTNEAGTGGLDYGTVKIALPSDFTISGATAIRSDRSGLRRVSEAVAIDPDRHSAYVTLPASTILSVRFTK